MGARVASAGETIACERAVMSRGTTSAELMRRAGEGAAALILGRFGDAISSGVAVFAGSGNNGGDGWVVAERLHRSGIAVCVREISDPKSEEAAAARASARRAGVADETHPAPGAAIVDALLGTGSRGYPRGPVATGIADIDSRRKAGSTVISLDLPSGLDATTGERVNSVVADCTISFGMLKRGHLLAREVCGAISVVDIGLDEADARGLPLLIDSEWVSARVPRIPHAAHKGTRKSLSIIGGGKGMAGALILSGEGALRSGIGLLRLVTAPGNEIAVHASIAQAMVHEWPGSAGEIENVLSLADALAIGPGLGKSDVTRDLVERVLLAWSGPVVLDADALNVFESDGLSLAQLLRGRPAVITPHPAEFSRLAGLETEQVTQHRFDVGRDLAAQLGAAVLLKGSPTIVFSPDGDRLVSPTGTAALATGGSGDVLTGMVGTMLAQMCTGGSPFTAAEAAACAAFVHGRAAELVPFVRGTTLADILAMFPAAWVLDSAVLPVGVLAELPA